MISGLLFNGVPRQLLKHALSGRFSLVLSPPILEELRGVLRRPKLGLTAEFVQIAVRKLETIAAVVYPAVSHKAVKCDRKDDMIVDCAVEGEADYIVSGDNHLLSIATTEGISIVTPKEFLEHLTSA